MSKRKFEVLLVTGDASRGVYCDAMDFERKGDELAIKTVDLSNVATIDVETINDAYQDLQNGVTFDSWSLLGDNVALTDEGRATIAWQKGKGLRSFSVGDVLHDFAAGPFEGYFICAPHGWWGARAEDGAIVATSPVLVYE